jgi:PKD domain-containing protein
MAAKFFSHKASHKAGILLLTLSSAATLLGQSLPKHKKGQTNPAAVTEMTTVPNVVGLSAPHASKVLANSQLLMNVTNGLENGVVLSQAPVADPNRRVNVVLGQPAVMLRVEKTPAEVDKPITVTAIVTPEMATTAYYYFDWGDGKRDIRQPSGVQSHAYSAPGHYQISVQVLLGDTKLSAQTDVLVVQPVKYSLTLEAMNPKLEVDSKGAFVAKLSPPPPASASVKYCFDWNEGPRECVDLAAETAKLEHSFAEPRSHVVTATATLETGATVTSKPVQVEVLAPPTVRLIPDTPFPLLGQPSGFTLTIVGQLPSEALVKYCFVWEMGAREDCPGSPRAAHAFNSAGIYDVAGFVEQDGARFAAAPVRLRVYEAALAADPPKSETGREINFQTTILPDSLSSLMQYCFNWDDGSRSCAGRSSLGHSFSSRGTYLTSVEVKIGDRTVAASAAVQVVIGWPVWLTAVLWGGGIGAIGSIGYGLKRWSTKRKLKKTRPASPRPVRLVPRLGQAPKYRMAAPQGLPKCLVRIRWMRGPLSASIEPQGNLVKKKGSAHAG